MKKLLVLAAVMLMTGGLFATGCTVHSSGVRVSSTPVVVASAPPARVYYGGRWLVYRTNAYYYQAGTRWVRARAVPSHVSHYHRPVASAPTRHMSSTRTPSRVSTTRTRVRVHRKTDKGETPKVLEFV